MSDFQIDPTLLADTIEVVSLDSSELRLLNDSRWPWLVLVPRMEGAVEWHDLYTDQRQDIDLDVSRVGGVLKALTACEKINIATIGNMVRQLHIHIIARSTGDPNWPGTVWGFGTRQAYDDDSASAFVAQLRDALEHGIG